MKITCQSCQSKYNVADEKVQGKVVKIRCRKCGATIVVDGTVAANGSGTGVSAPEPGPTRSAATDESASGAQAGGVQWHVNVAENDQRTMSLAELVDAYNTGVVTQDTFIWTDGMDDWKPLGEVEAVVSALHAAASADPAPSTGFGAGAGAHPFVHDAVAAAALSAQAMEPSFPQPAAAEAQDPSTRVYDSSASASAGASAFAPVASAAASKAEPKRAAVVKRDGRARDLFASRADDGPGAFDVQTSAPAFATAASPGPAADDPSKRTGERNENSVLFSLAVLTQSAEQRAPTNETATNDDSGLIDLKALAAKTESMRPPAMVADASVFAPPLGAVAPLGAPLGALGSPLGGDTQPKSRLPMIIGGIAGFAFLMLAAGVIGAKFFAGGAPDATAATASASAAVTAPSASAEVEAAASASAAPSATASAAPSATVAATPKPRVVGGGGGSRPQGGPAKPAGGGAAAAAGGGGDNGAAAAPPPKKTNDCGCNGDLMCLMKCSTH
jgi:predicted Zn finger-like uncharacterized protein